MKALLSIVVFCIWLLSYGCASDGTIDGTIDIPIVPSGGEVNCTIYEEYGATPENSIIAKRIKDPCQAKRLIIMAAKLPAIEWEKKYTVEFEKWAAFIEARLEDGITYAELQDIVIIEIAKLNKKVGMALLVVSDAIFVFDDNTKILEIDMAMLKALIQDLRREVKLMEAMAKSKFTIV